MTTAIRLLATALLRARFASGLPTPTYTTSRDTTRINRLKRERTAMDGICGSKRRRQFGCKRCCRHSTLSVSHGKKQLVTCHALALERWQRFQP